MKKKAYISGPMTGKPWWNFPEFLKVQGVLEYHGWIVVNPAELDLHAWGQSALPTVEQFRDGEFDSITEDALDRIIGRDVTAIRALRVENGDAIALLDGWEVSKGARAEAALGIWKGLKVWPWRELPEDE